MYTQIAKVGANTFKSIKTIQQKRAFVKLHFKKSFTSKLKEEIRNRFWDKLH